MENVRMPLDAGVPGVMPPGSCPGSRKRIPRRAGDDRLRCLLRALAAKGSNQPDDLCT